MQGIYKYRMSRRTLLGTAAALGVGTLLLRSGDDGCAAPAAAEASQVPQIKHNMWVWRFDVDGSPNEVLDRVRHAGLGVLLKVADGPDWMSRYDDSPTAITGPAKVREMADFFESAGVPFHAWTVVKGLDPVAEAHLASEALNNGARSVTFDLEPSDGGSYWQGDSQAAVTLGQEVRRLQPHAHLAVAPDARPWQISAVPLWEFAAFCNEILPQTYWQTFDGPTNLRRIGEYGFNVSGGMSPELILDVTAASLAPFGLPVAPIGQGAANGSEWQRFVSHAFSLGMKTVSVWRYGTTHSEVWPTISAMPPAQPAPPPTPEPTPEPTQVPPTPEPTAEPTPPPLVQAEPPSEGQPQTLQAQQSAPAGQQQSQPASAPAESTPADVYLRVSPGPNAGSQSSAALAASQGESCDDGNG